MEPDEHAYERASAAETSQAIHVRERLTFSVHSYASTTSGDLALVVLYFYFVVVHELALLAGALAWLTHVAVDRTLGFGLRWLPTSKALQVV
ncbi:MAG: DUF4260 family protein [Candidatus Dormibacteraeota bacterium]|jgi:hypothetical protein|nr:DUF4260 family protein [Candidatus Dormibacteraeota bacterium]